MEVGWEIPCDLIEDRFRGEYMLEESIKVVGCEFDEMADAIVFRFEIDPGDYGRIPTDGPDGNLIDANF